MADDSEQYAMRMRRTESRFWRRSEERDNTPKILDIFKRDMIDSSFAQYALDPENFKLTAENETNDYRQYMVNESVQQFKDYYESDAEE